MGDVTSGGVQDDAAANADIGGAGLDTGPSYGQSPGAMGGTVPPDVQPTVIKSFDPGVYSQPLSSNVTGGNPAIPSLSVNDAHQANLDFLSGISALAGGQSPGAMGGRRGDDSPTFSSRPDPSTAMPLSVLTNPTGSVFRDPNSSEFGNVRRDQEGRMAVTYGPAGLYFPTDSSGNIGTGPAFAALEKGSQRDAFITRPINEPMGGGRILPELEADPFAPLGGTGVTPQDVIFQRASRAFDEPDPGGIIGPIRTTVPDVGMLYGRGFTPIDARQRPDPNEINMFSSTATQDFPPPGPGLGLSDNPDLARAIATQQGAKLYKEIQQGRQPKNEEEKTIFQKVVDYFSKVLRGDPNYKGPSAAQQQLMGVPGPGPFVGGGVPSPSGGGGGGMPAKDPCPPGFRFDPILQQCVPIIAPNPPTDTTTTPTDPTPAAGTSPPVAGGGIADAYPYTLTPPIGAPVGTIPPVRLTT